MKDKFIRNVNIAIIILFMCCVYNAFAANEWMKGDGSQIIEGDESVSDIDAISFQNGFDPLDRLLGRYQSGATVTFNSTTAIDFTRGEVSCQNSGATITRMRANTSTVTLTNSDLDVGASFANSSTYYVYAVADADAATFTGTISLNSSTPDSGAATYYKLLGSFGTDSSGDIIDGSITAPAETPDIAIETVYDYGTSASSSTTYATGVFIAFGEQSIGASSTSSISNLPFTSTARFQCFTSNAQIASTQFENACVKDSASAITIHNKWSGGTATIYWMAIGT